MLPEFIKIENEPNLVKNTKNKAVLNIDRSSIQRHQQRIARQNKEQEYQNKVNSLDERMTNLESDIQQILKILKN